jgi:hypothetical protein
VGFDTAWRVRQRCADGKKESERVKQPPKPQEEREWTDDELLRAAELDEEKFGPLGDQLSITEAFALHVQIADELHVSTYKTQALFHRALRKHDLTKIVQGFVSALAVEAKKAGTTISRVWAKLEMPDELIEHSEVTSPKALRTLFTLRRERRRELDRKRKAGKACLKKHSEKIVRSAGPPKTEDSEQKRKLKTKKRNLDRKKRKR